MEDLQTILQNLMQNWVIVWLFVFTYYQVATKWVPFILNLRKEEQELLRQQQKQRDDDFKASLAKVTTAFEEWIKTFEETINIYWQRQAKLETSIVSLSNKIDLIWKGRMCLLNEKDNLSNRTNIAFMKWRQEFEETKDEDKKDEQV